MSGASYPVGEPWKGAPADGTALSNAATSSNALLAPTRHMKGKGHKMHITKRAEGAVEYNDGEFAEVLTYGTEGVDKGIALETIQISREDTEEASGKFQCRFPVGSRLSIVTITEVNAI